MHRPLPGIDRHQSCKVTARNIGSKSGIKIPAEPQPLPLAEDIHFQSLIWPQCGIAKHITAGIDAAPDAAAPVSNECHLPSSNDRVQRPGSVACKFFALAKWQFVDGVISDAMRRDIG